jgi:hypothetical protein
VGEKEQEVEKWVRRSRKWKSGREGAGGGKVGEEGREVESGIGGAEAEKLGMESRRWKSGREGAGAGKVGEKGQEV